MRILKAVLVCIFWLLIIALMLAPLGLIYQISNNEMAEYATPEALVLRETAIGQAVRAYRMDVPEYVTLEGTFTSNTYDYMELSEYKNPSNIRWLVSVGDEIQEGQVIGTYNGSDVIATITGILVEMNTYTSISSNAYLCFQLFEPIEFSCSVEDRVLSTLRRSESLSMEDGAAVTLVYASRQKNADGTTDVRLSIDTDKYVFGQELEELKVFTGQVYGKTLVLPVECVYQWEEGEDNPWYVRQVSETGIFLAEKEVQVGYSNGDVICVTGVEEGDYFDSGYKAIVGGGNG